jgi:hypothetical protein
MSPAISFGSALPLATCPIVRQSLGGCFHWVEDGKPNGFFAI